KRYFVVWLAASLSRLNPSRWLVRRIGAAAAAGADACPAPGAAVAPDVALMSELSTDVNSSVVNRPSRLPSKVCMSCRARTSIGAVLFTEDMSLASGRNRGKRRARPELAGGRGIRWNDAERPVARP